jgi:hypothetical protein
MRKTKISKPIDIEVEIELEDVLEFIDSANQNELDQIADALGDNFSEDDAYNLSPEAEMKHEIFKKASAKFSVLELCEKLGVDWL